MSKQSIVAARFMAVLAVSLMAAAPASADSPRLRNTTNNHLYQRYDTTRTFNQAKSFCKSLGGYLATVTSSQENTFVYNNVCRNSPQWCWLGGTDVQTEGIWSWLSGEKFSYSTWDSGEPNNCNGIEHYLMYFTPPDGRAGLWNDLGTGFNAQGVAGGCGCGGCIDEWYPMSTVCEWDKAPTRVMGLINWWPANGNAADTVGGNDGALVGGASFATGGVSGQAFSLNGADGYITVPDRPNLNFGDQDFSVAVWVKFNTLQGEQVLVEKYVETLTLPSYGWTLTKLADNSIRFTGGPRYPYDLPNDITLRPAAIAPGVWYLVVATRTGNTLALYWNSKLLGSATAAFNPDSPATLKIGHRGNPDDTPGSNDTSGFYLNGLVDEVMIFNHALIADEVTNLFTNRAANAAIY